VEWLEEALEQTNILFPAPARAEAIATANTTLNTYFYRHPGFLLKDADLYSAAQVEHIPWDWAMGLTEVSFFPNIDGPTLGIVGVSASVRNVSGTTIDVVSLKTCWNELRFLNGRNLVRKPRANCSISDLMTPIVLQDRAILSNDWQFIGNPLLGIVNSLSLRGGTAASPQIAAMKGLTRSLVEQPMLSGNAVAGTDGTDIGSWDTVILAPEGEFVAGFALGADQNAKITSGSSLTTLGPHFEERSGGYGGTATLLQCQTGQVPIGIRVAPGTSVEGIAVVNYFGIVCADRVWLTGTSNVSTRRIVRGRFRDQTTGWSYNPGNFLASGETWTGTTDHICPRTAGVAGYIMSGLTVRGAGYVDRIETLNCSSGSSIAVGVGGFGGALSNQQCMFAPGPRLPLSTESYSPYVQVRSGDWMDSIAVGCYGKLDFALTFENDVKAPCSIPEPAGTVANWCGFVDAYESPVDAFIQGTGTTALIASGAPQGTKYASATGANLTAGALGAMTYANLDLRGALATSILLSWKFVMNSGSGVTAPFKVFVDPVGPEVRTQISPAYSKGSAWQDDDYDLAPLFRGKLVDIVFEVQSPVSGAWVAAVDNVQVVSSW